MAKKYAFGVDIGAAGEIGHIKVVNNEPEACGCGKHGCLEQYASATGIVRLAKIYLASDESPTVLLMQPQSSCICSGLPDDRPENETCGKSVLYLFKGKNKWYNDINNCGHIITQRDNLPYDRLYYEGGKENR